MYKMSRALPVNDPSDPDQPVLTRSDIWRGLLLKAYDARPFVPLMSKCEVVEEYEGGLVRNIVFNGDAMGEKLAFFPEERVEFTRTWGPELGVIYNEIEEGENGDLSLRFTFVLEREGIEPGSEEERDHFQELERSYLNAVSATLAHLRTLSKTRSLV
jgi:hypothetical protein